MSSTVTTTTKQVTKPVPKQKSAKSGSIPKQKSGNLSMVKNSGSHITLDVPECVTHYAMSLVNPFDTPPGVCVPSELFPVPTQKTKVFLAGTFELGTTGYGYIVCRGTVANNITCLITSTASSVGASNTNFGEYTNQLVHQISKLPYPSEAFTGDDANHLSARIAAMGIRIKYVGKLMDRGGVAVAMEHPDHNSLYLGDPGTASYDAMMSSPYATRKRIGDGKWDSAACYSGPVNPSDLDLAQNSIPLGGNNFLAIGVSGQPGDKFLFEFVEHIEYAGVSILARTKSHAEPVLFAKVAETAKSLSIDGPLSPDKEPSFWSELGQKFLSTLPKLVSFGANVFRAVEGDFSAIPSIMGDALGMIRGSSIEHGNAGSGMPRLTSANLETFGRHRSKQLLLAN